MSVVKYHFVITLQWTTPTGYVVRTQYGTVNIEPGMTRTQTLKYLLDRMQEGMHGVPTIMFFSLDPDELQGGAL